jgi:hypothetical protein
MRISTVYPGMYSTLPDITDYGTASCVCVCLWNCADTRTSTVCLLQSVVDNFPLWLVYRAHSTYYHPIYFTLQQAQLSYVILTYTHTQIMAALGF